MKIMYVHFILSNIIFIEYLRVDTVKRKLMGSVALSLLLDNGAFETLHSLVVFNIIQGVRVITARRFSRTMASV